MQKVKIPRIATNVKEQLEDFDYHTLRLNTKPKQSSQCDVSIQINKQVEQNRVQSPTRMSDPLIFLQAWKGNSMYKAQTFQQMVLKELETHV